MVIFDRPAGQATERDDWSNAFSALNELSTDAVDLMTTQKPHHRFSEEYRLGRIFEFTFYRTNPELEYPKVFGDAAAYPVYQDLAGRVWKEGEDPISTVRVSITFADTDAARSTLRALREAQDRLGIQ